MAKQNFNKEPYFDTFNSKNNYMKVLYRAGSPVQARELNEMQSIAGNQRKEFADHVFKNGSRVSGGSPSLNSKSYVRLKDLVPETGDELILDDIKEGTIVIGATSNIKAIVVHKENANDVDPPTIFVVYKTTGSDGEKDTFIPGETLEFRDENNQTFKIAAVRCKTCPGEEETDTVEPVGRSMFFTLPDGVYYYEGMFIDAYLQNIIVEKYIIKDENAINAMNDGTVPPEPMKIGLDVVHSEVTYLDDPNLLDPSLGYPNSTAPGADRYKVELLLSRRSYDEADGDNFILLAKIGPNFTVEYMKEGSEYAELLDNLAQRSYEANGNFTTKPYKVDFFHSKKSSPSDVEGWTIDGDPDKLIALVSPSVSYVKGYRVENKTEVGVSFEKARDVKNIENTTLFFDERQNVVLEPTNGVIWANDINEPSMMSLLPVTMYDTNDASIGTFKVFDMKDIKNKPGFFRYYIYDLVLSDGFSLKDVVRVEKGNFKATPENGVFTLRSANNTSFVYPINAENIKSLRRDDVTKSGSIQMTLRRKYVGTLDGNATYTLNATTNLVFPKLTGKNVVWVEKAGTIYQGDNSNLTTTGDTMVIDFSTHAEDLSNQTFVLLTNILVLDQKEKTKTITSGSDSFNNIGNTEIAEGVSYPLTEVDLIGDYVVNIYDKNNLPLKDGGGNIIDFSGNFTLENVTTDFAYTTPKLICDGKLDVTLSDSNNKITVEYNYLDHTETGFARWFNVDSYEGEVDYENIPTYTSTQDDVYRLADSFDFRPAFRSGDTTTNALLPAPRTEAIFDVSYYLPRIDLLQVNKDGQFVVKKGKSDVVPRVPKKDFDSMAIYEIWLKPYTYSLNDINTKYIENKGYTMADIGRLEKRISSLEYYTALTLSEKTTIDMSIKDVNGVDRFKNGFIADGFNSFQAGDIGAEEFRASIDKGRQELRPSFKSYNFKLKPDKSLSSSNILWKGFVGMMKYTEEVTSTNPYATKFISINPYYQYSKEGLLSLSPNNDTWSDEKRLPKVVTDIDTGSEAIKKLADAAGVLGVEWGSWTAQNTTTTINSTNQFIETETNETNRMEYYHANNHQRSFGVGGRYTVTDKEEVKKRITVQNITIDKGLVREGTKTTVGNKKQTHTITDIVKDVQIKPYIRSIDVEFYASKMKPSTKVYAFFDGVSVSENCRSLKNKGTQFGETLVTDENGELFGQFRIPEGRFFNGEKKFVLTDDPSGNTLDQETTRAEALYFGGGLDVTKQDETFNIITPTFETQEISQRKPVLETKTIRTEQVISVNKTHECETIECRCAMGSWEKVCHDPVAQAFTLDNDCFVTGVDVFFQNIDEDSNDLYVEIRKTVNGYPSDQVIQRKDFTLADLKVASDVVVSDTSTVATSIKFETPVFVNGNEMYCFVVGGFSPSTTIWVARLGDEVVDIPGKIVESQPTSGSSFRSKNGLTWTAEQYETIKYNLYTARFETGNMDITFKLDNDANFSKVILDEDPIETENGSKRVRIYFKDHGLQVNDKVKLSIFEDTNVTFKTSGEAPLIGQELVGESHGGVIPRATISDVSFIQNANGFDEYSLTLTNINGDFVIPSNETEASVTIPSKNVKLRDTTIPKSRNTKTDVDAGWNMPELSGFVVANYTLPAVEGSAFAYNQLGGISLEELNSQVTVKEVDSSDSFIIETTGTATNTGRWGDFNVGIYDYARKYDMFNVSGSYISYTSPEDWSLNGIQYNDGNQKTYSMTPMVDNYLTSPLKVTSKDDTSVTITGSFISNNSLISPMINTDTFSFIGVSNRIEMLDPEVYEVEPNSSGRFVAEDEETLVNKGTEIYKYVSKNVLLDNPASDLMIWVDVCKFAEGDFDIYVKRVISGTNEVLKDQPWIKATDIDKSKSATNEDDYTEYNVKCSEQIEGWNEEEQFSSFKIKIVGRSSNSCKPTTFKTFRAIAVT